MITYTGESVWPEGKGYPSLFSIGVALGRIPRFAGHTKHWYPVLPHALTVASLLPDEYKLYGLLHDAQESCMSDVPTPWKTEAARRREYMLLRRIYQGNGIVWPISDDAQEKVDWADTEALAAEAHALGHVAAEEVWAEYNPYVKRTVSNYLRDDVTKFLDADYSGELFVEMFNKYKKLLPDECISDLTLFENAG